MSVFWSRVLFFVLVVVASAASVRAQPQSSSSSSSSSSTTRAAQKAARTTHTDSSIDAGRVTGGVYRNQALGLACKIPPGWVLRTDEMNADDDENGETKTEPKGGKVLLATFSRPPEARGEDVNSSIVIAAEPATSYPGLKDPAQYFEPLTEVAKAQGFSVVEEPYEFKVGTKTLPRADFQKDVGSRVMRQSTLTMLARGWAVSITLIGGTEDEVEELVSGLSFAVASKTAK